MKPDAEYRTLQSQLRSLCENPDPATSRREVRRILERTFMAAWNLKPDRLRLSRRLLDKIERLTTSADCKISGLDHCTAYTAEGDRRVIVTQPYGGDRLAELGRSFMLDRRVAPEIVDASDWAFYYPGKANLYILTFPWGYADALSKFKILLEKDRVSLLPILIPYASTHNPA